MDNKLSKDEQFEKHFGHLKLQFQVLKEATNHFHDDYRIGEGLFGIVYKASLPKSNLDTIVEGHPTGRLAVAIKRGNDKNRETIYQFKTEIQLLYNFKHPNIVHLVGYCDEGDELILVYEYAPNKSLDTYIHRRGSSSSITWARILKICIGVAHGINHLHLGDGKFKIKTVHRDIKSANIFLGKNRQAVIGDFGLSVFAKPKEELSSLRYPTAGTEGYVDPFYEQTGQLSEKVDVYSFGVLLGEVKNLLWEDRFKEASHRYVDEISNLESKCVRYHPDDRPEMTDIIEDLEKLLIDQIAGLNLRFSLEEIVKATKNFDNSNIIGWGESSMVYKGVVSTSHRSKTVAVKRFMRSVEEKEVNFLTDILTFNDYKHKNVICIQGFHFDEKEKIVIYEYAFRGSLDKYLSKTSNKRSLTWVQSLKICLGAARGLDFIHTSEHQNGVVHGDIKSSNILLTRRWKAKINNFGLSKRVCRNRSKFLVSSGAGTLGYCDPAYMDTGVLTKASDVFSFGLVLLEVLGKRMVLENDRYYGEQMDGWTKQHKTPDVNKYEQFSQSLSTFLAIARRCVEEKPERRPTMGEVVQELTKALNFEVNVSKQV